MNHALLAASLLPVAAVAATEPSTTTTPTIVVTATRFAEPEASILAPVNIITRDEIDRLQAQTVTELVRTLPGVGVIDYGGRGQSSSLSVRGGTSAQTLVLLDGMRVNSVTSGAADLNALPLNQVERIEYVRGARASLYGADAIGGVINIITRPDPGTNEHVLHAGGGTNGGKEAAWHSAATVGQTGQLKVAAGYADETGYNVHPVAGVNDGDQHGHTGYNALVDYQHLLNEQVNLFGSARWFRNIGQYDNSYSSSFGDQHQRMETWSDNQLYQLGGRYHQGAYQSTLQADMGRHDDYNYQASQSHDDAQDRTYIRHYQLSWLHDLQLNDDWRGGSGVDWRREELASGSMSSGTAYPNGAQGRNNTGLYALAQYQHQAWQAELSGRTDDNQQYGRHNTWQAGAGWRFYQTYRISARYGTGFRAPSFSDLYYPDAYTPGNPDLKPETSRNRELMLDGVTAGVTWRATAYRNDIADLIQWSPDASSGLWQPENVGQARVNGLELDGEFDTGPLSHRVALDVKDPKNVLTNKQLQRVAKQEASWTVQGEWQQWQPAVTWRYQGARYDDAANTTRMGGYTTLDTALGYRATPAWTIKAKASNLLNHGYETASGYPAAGRQFNLSTDYRL